MTDAVRRLRLAQRRGDLLAAAQAVLEVNGLDSRPAVDRALAALDGRVEPQPTPVRHDVLTEPMTLVALFPADQRLELWRALTRTSHRRLAKVPAVIDPPPEIMADLVAAFMRPETRQAPRLGPIDGNLADHHEIDAAASRAWYLRYIGTTGRLVAKVADNPRWVTAVHSDSELTSLRRMIQRNC